MERRASPGRARLPILPSQEAERQAARAGAVRRRPPPVPAPRPPVFGSAPLWSILVLAGAALLVAAPLASLVWTAAGGDASTWGSLARDVLPAAMAETVLLLAGVAGLTGLIGVGAAWFVTVHRFPGRDLLVWLLPLPLAVPAYITAYVYVEVFDAAGPVQTALRALTG